MKTLICYIGGGVQPYSRGQPNPKNAIGTIVEKGKSFRAGFCKFYTAGFRTGWYGKSFIPRFILQVSDSKSQIANLRFKVSESKSKINFEIF